MKKQLLRELLEHIETNDPGCPMLPALRERIEAHPVGYYDPITRKFATSPNAFPRAATIVPLYRED